MAMICKLKEQMSKLLLLPIIFMSVGHMGQAADDGSDSGTDQKKLEKATFAGGCFWCMEPPFEKLKGVKEVIAGYTGGHKENPTYKEVSAGKTGHCEAILVQYDSTQMSYEELLDVFWRNIDPTAVDRQFVDVGGQYRSAIFYHNDEQRRLAEESKKKLAASGRFDKPIVTEITPASTFYPAEEYHQDYHQKNPWPYKFYRFNSGRDQFLDRAWGKERKE